MEQALLFAIQIAHGMRHACEQIPGFVHRDLKPENVIVGADRLPSLKTNRLRVTDFGLANILQEVGDQIPSLSDPPDSVSRPAFSRTQLTHGIVGTPLYMAPEQWGGGELGICTDVYALGCMLYEMLTSRRPVRGDSLDAIQQAHCQGHRDDLPADLPAPVCDIVNGCLGLDPESRYQTWAELETALGAAWEAITTRQLPPAEATQELDREERVAVGWSYNNLGMSYLDIGKVDVSRTYFEQARSVGQQEGESHLEGGSLGNLGLVYLNLGDARRAISYHEQHLEIAREIGNRRGEGTALGNLGNAYKDLGDARRAIGYYEQALEISREIGNRRGEGIFLAGLGNAYGNIGEARRAIGYYEQALAIARETENRSDEGAALGDLGGVYFQIGDVLRAIEYLKKHLSIACETGDRSREGNARGSLGNAYVSIGDARQAIYYYEECLEIQREIGDRRSESTTLNNLGIAYQNLGEAWLAIEYYKQSLVNAREIENRRGEGNALGNLGNAYRELGDTRRAIRYYEQCLEIHREIEDIISIATDSFNIAMLYSQEGDLQKALAMAKEAARIWTQIGHAQYAQRAQQLVAQLQGGKSPSGAEVVQAAFESFKQAAFPQEMQTAASQYPFMTDDSFIQAVEQVIAEQVHPEHKPAFQERLDWLRQIKEEQK
jgi:tetratricopeptide (TPR) repeat protein